MKKNYKEKVELGKKINEQKTLRVEKGKTINKIKVQKMRQRYV